MNSRADTSSGCAPASDGRCHAHVRLSLRCMYAPPTFSSIQGVVYAYDRIVRMIESHIFRANLKALPQY